MTTVRELYEFWSGESVLAERLKTSLSPRGKDWLFELFASLGPQPGQVVVDVGARDGQHLARLVEEHRLEGVALDPVPQDDKVAIGTMEAMPLADASADWIWARDVLVHVEVEVGFAECARVLRPRGHIVAYVTLATDLLEPREAAELHERLALTTLDGARIEAAASAAGFELLRKEELGGEWRERMVEDGEWNPSESLLGLSRLRRLGESGLAASAFRGGHLWGIYQLIGKLNPTVFVWTRA